MVIQEASAQKVSLMSFNIRYDNPSDPLAWDDRKKEIADMIRYQDIVGVQEALHHQKEYIDNQLPRHDCFGVGRDDGKEGGEYSPIFYNTDKFQLLHGETIWLSESRHIAGSKSWDAELPRIATIVLLYDFEAQKTVRVINTHLSHVGITSRGMAIRIIKSYLTHSSSDVNIFMGDLNEEPDGENFALFNDWRLKDTFETARIKCREKLSTYNTFLPEESIFKRIDYIFTDIENVNFVCVDEQIKWGFYLSDHSAVVSTFYY